MLIINNNQGANDTFILYEKDSKIQQYVKRDINPVGKFKAKILGINSSSEENLGISHTNYEIKRIETNAFLDFKEGDIVLDVRNNKFYKIADNGIIINENYQMTQFSKRPIKQTILTLIRKVE